MKKLCLFVYLTFFAALYSSGVYADRGHGHYARHHHHHHHYDHYSRPSIQYYSVIPVVHHYYPQPPVAYYPQPPSPSGYDQRSRQGLAGGVVGSVFGYELGGGDPLATGLGAAAGSLLGNEVGGSGRGRW